ncbi:predicted protein [Naegleria gruberi]|uniref:Predicted protein n=1 Tax=Naegleria gruberi TaxID=5762 RepID=D2VL07_NAEGR|nr:uncharacterized protein NAEGRDRAFT_69618 [Naegleria gruberi]EFC42539.1 predicted protein [Naegleria gruberi]|eukprot:XP_002675283.1 predicted protein [Naegleria gruberi strain NEG-M]
MSLQAKDFLAKISSDLICFLEHGGEGNNGISNSTLLKAMLKGSLGVAVLNEIYYMMKSLMRERESENMIFDRKNVEKTIDCMRRDVIRFISCNGVVMSGLAICSHDYSHVLEKSGILTKIAFFLTTIYSPAVIAEILDWIGISEYDHSVYEKDSTILPFRKSKQDGRGIFSGFYNFLKKLFIEQSFPRLLLLTSLTPFINILIGNRLVPNVKYSATSNLVLDEYKHDPVVNQQLIETLEKKKYTSLFLSSYFLSLGHGISMNTLCYWGEERGWRDFMWNRLIKIEKLEKRKDAIDTLEFFKNSMLIGFISGLWNVPLTLAGINYGANNSRWGVIPMVLSHTLLSPLLCFVTQKIKNETNTIRDYGIISSFARGIYEAMGGLSQYLSDVSNAHDKRYGNILVGPNSLSSCATLALLNLGLFIALSHSTNRFSSTSKK